MMFDRNPRLRAGWLCLLCALALLAALPIQALAAPEKPQIAIRSNDLSITDGLPKHQRTVLVMVVDPPQGMRYAPTETMLLASIDTRDGAARMTVLPPRMLVPVPQAGTLPLAQAFALGGENLAMKTVNEVFGLNVRDYVCVDMSRFTPVVDVVGGIHLTLTEQEAAALGLPAAPVVLDVAQTLAYMRLERDDPSVDRQYNVLMQALVQGTRDRGDLRLLLDMLGKVMGSVDTNIGVFDLGSLGIKVLGGDVRLELRLPAADALTAVTLDGQRCYETDLDAARRTLHTYLYGGE